jgi:cytochrome oxidase assembly protein ShyY1
VFRVLTTPRWLALAGLAVLLAGVMVRLGIWQLHRYEERSAINARIDAGRTAQPQALPEVVPAPDGGPGTVGRPAAADAAWTRVAVTGEYDLTNEILARGRTLDGAVGFEVVTPLVLPDGSAVLVDRGWLPSPPGGARVTPDVPPAPTGPVTVVGRVHPPESRSGAVTRTGGRFDVRRIAPAHLATHLPYPLFDVYLNLDSQDPPAAPGLAAITPPHENALQNAAYVVQWWLFAALTLVGAGYLARRESGPPMPRDRAPAGVDRLA